MTGFSLFHGKEIPSPMINAVEIGAGRIVQEFGCDELVKIPQSCRVLKNNKELTKKFR